MKRFTWLLFIIALIVTGIYTFRPQPQFPGVSGGPGNAKTTSQASTPGNL